MKNTNSQPRFVIIGENSLIARSVTRRLIALECNFIKTSRSSSKGLSLDLSNTTEFDFSLINDNDLVVVFAAISSPDVCQKDFDESQKVNVEGTISISSECLKRGAKVLLFSSDMVYGESELPVDESAAFKPLGNYAKMKYEVECFFKNEKNLKIFRLSYVFSKKDKFTSYLDNCASENNVAEIYHPFYRNAVYINDVVDSIIAISSKWDDFPQQVINVGGPDLLSRLDIANLYLKYIDPNLKFKATEPSLEFFRHRPKSIHMLSPKVEELLGRPRTRIEEAIANEFNI